MRTHPLLSVADQIVPEETYTLADLARLTGRSRSSVGHWLRGGLLGQPHTEETTGAAPAWRWALAGTTLLDAVHAPMPAPDHHSPAAERQAWRRGCRDDSGTCSCREHHNRSTRQARQRRAEARFPASAQREFLRLVRLRMPVPEAAHAVGMTEPAVNGYARSNPQFAARFASARERLCSKRADCGSAAGWRSGCRGLWCWQQNRDARKRERERAASATRVPARPRGRARADDAARALGHPDADAYLAAHPDHSAKRLAAALGVSHTSVKRWRA